VLGTADRGLESACQSGLDTCTHRLTVAKMNLDNDDMNLAN
jgi:hypothetical protein